MPAAHPVNYLFDGEEIVFRTGGGAKLAAAARGVDVALQVDKIDVDRCSGWSVFGIGEAYEMVDPARCLSSPTGYPPRGRPTAPHCISIPLQRLAGRWL